MDDVNSWIVGIGAGFVASVALFLILFSLRPRLEISSNITKLLSDGPLPEYRYRIKIVNRSWRSCLDVSVRVWLVSEGKVPSRKTSKTTPLNTMTGMGESRSVGFYPGYRPWDKGAHYAQRLRLNAECMTQWLADPKQYLLVRVTARDGVSGFPRAFSRQYEFATQLMEGYTFVGGRSTSVVPYEARGHEAQPPMTGFASPAA